MLTSSEPLQDGEMLFSGCARLCGVNALVDTRMAMEMLTGGRNFGISADLPCHIQAIFERVGSLIGAMSPDDLFEKHTLYPYYRVFSPRQRWAEVHAIALGNQGGRLKAKIGMLAHGISASPVMRCCLACTQASLLGPGAAYWHCMHNLPGVTACARHGIVLAGSFSQAQLGHRAKLLMPPQRVNTSPVPATHAQMQIAEISLDLLLYQGESVDPLSASNAYAGAMRDFGWIRGRTQLAIGPLALRLRQSFSGCFDDRIADRFGLHGTRKMSWIQPMLGGRSRLASPLAHVMLIAVLFGSFDRFLAACMSPCIDLTTDQPRASMACDADWSRFAHARPLVVDPTVSCSQIARTCGVSVGWALKQRQLLGISIHERPKRFKGELKSVAQKLLGKGVSVAEVAHRCGLSASTVYRFLSSQPDLGRLCSSAVTEQCRAMHRDAWRRLLGNHPGAGVKLLRSMNGAAYAWLYRHDLEWLQLNAPPKAARRLPTRIDWEARDAKLAKATSSLKAIGILSKRTRTAAGTAALVYPASSMRRHSTKLPRFAAAIKAAVAKAG